MDRLDSQLWMSCLSHLSFLPYHIEEEESGRHVALRKHTINHTLIDQPPRQADSQAGRHPATCTRPTAHTARHTGKPSSSKHGRAGPSNGRTDGHVCMCVCVCVAHRRLEG